MIEEIGRGGMGVVYRARQLELGRIVALKAIKPGVEFDPERRHRFRNEAEAVARIQHPNIVQIYGVVEHEQRPYLVLEFVDGESLEGRLDGRPWPSKEAARMIEDLARAIHEAHQHGIVHRDLKPGNVLLARGKHMPKVTDFGLAKLLDAETQQSRSGLLLGTPLYMAPEQAAGQSWLIGPATDVYALGVILYELLTGKRPFRGESMQVLEQVRYRDPVPPRRLEKGVPSDLSTICLKCLSKEPDRRYASAVELADDLRRWRGNEPILARPAGVGERLLLWARRRPAQAAAATLLVLLVITGSIAGAFTRLWMEAAAARRQLTAANRQLAAVNDENEFLVYVNELGRAKESARANEFGAMQLYLNGCPERFRNWEWSYLREACPLKQTFYVKSVPVISVRVSPDSRLIAAGGRDGAIRFWRIGDPEPHAIIKAHREFVRALSFSPDGSHLASVGDDNRVCVWETTTRRAIWSQELDPGLRAVAFSPDGRWLATGGFDKVVRVWDAQNWKPRGELKHETRVLGLCFVPGADRLATACDGGQLYVWDWKREQRLSPPQMRHDDHAYCVSSNAKGNLLISASADRTLRIWDADSFEPRGILGRHDNDVNQVLFNGDGTIVASCGDDSVVRVWDPATRDSTRVLKGHLGDANSVSFSPDGTILVSGGDDGAVRVWDVRRKEQTSLPDGYLSTACFVRQGILIATARVDDTIVVCNSTTGQHVKTLTGHRGRVNSLCMAADGARLAAVTNHEVLYQWDIRTGALELESRPWVKKQSRVSRFGHFADVPLTSSVCFSPDGRRLAYCCNDTIIRILDLDTKKEMILSGHTDVVSQLCFNWRSNRLLTGGYDGDCRLWDATSGQAVRTFSGHDDYVRALCFSPDDSLVATGSEDFSIRIWDTRTGRELRQLVGHKGYVIGLSFSPDGARLASIGSGEPVKLWDTRRGAELITLGEIAGGYTDVRFSPNGTTIFACARERSLDVWIAQNSYQYE
jgi:WD40 repeat protein